MLIDIDGTFVFNSANVSEGDLEAFHMASKQSLMAIATGRSIKEIEYIEKENNIKLDYKIGFNGALIVDKDDNIIFDKAIEKTTLISLVDYLEQEQIIFDALDNKHRFGNFYHEKADELLGVAYTHLEDPYSYVKKQHIYKINIRPASLEAATKLTTYLKEHFTDLAIFQVGKRRIEISANETSKGNALNMLRKNDITTIAIGDSENDISMFQAADSSYCMEHAPESTSKEATQVVPRFKDAISDLLTNKEGATR